MLLRTTLSCWAVCSVPGSVTHLIGEGMEDLQRLVVVLPLTEVVVDEVGPKPGRPLSVADDVTHPEGSTRCWGLSAGTISKIWHFTFACEEAKKHTCIHTWHTLTLSHSVHKFSFPSQFLNREQRSFAYQDICSYIMAQTHTHKHTHIFSLLFNKKWMYIKLYFAYSFETKVKRVIKKENMFCKTIQIKFTWNYYKDKTSSV